MISVNLIFFTLTKYLLNINIHKSVERTDSYEFRFEENIIPVFNQTVFHPVRQYTRIIFFHIGIGAAISISNKNRGDEIQHTRFALKPHQKIQIQLIRAEAIYSRKSPRSSSIRSQSLARLFSKIAPVNTVLRVYVRAYSVQRRSPAVNFRFAILFHTGVN